MVTGGPELLRLVQVIQQEKDIDPEVLFTGLELAIETAIRKRFLEADELSVQIDRQSGQIVAYRDGILIEAQELGRIAAQTAKQVIFQKIREAEQDAVINEYADRLRELTSGTIQRFERDDIIVGLAKGEGILPRSERVRGENPRVGDRIRAVVLDVRRIGNRVRVILSRTHPDMIRRLFELEVPEISEGIIEIKHLSREPGYRTKMAVASYDPKIHCVGACVGLRGSRIRNVIDELNGEKIDIIPWDDSAEVLIMNSLKPAEIDSITLDEETGEAEVVVSEDQLSLAIGKKGQNVRLAAKLTGWAINIVSGSDASIQAMADPPATFDELLDAEGGAAAPSTEPGVASSEIEAHDDGPGEQPEALDPSMDSGASPADPAAVDAPSSTDDSADGTAGFEGSDSDSEDHAPS